MKRRYRPYAQQAADEAALRFGPQQEGLIALLGDTRGQYRSDLAQADVARQILQNSARSAGEAFTQSPLQAQIDAQYANPQSGVARQYANHIGLTREAFQSGLADAIQRAGRAEVFQGQAARQQLGSSLSKINDQAQGLRGQIGTFTQARLGELIGDDRKARAEARALQQRLSADLTRAQLSAQTQMRGQDLSYDSQQDAIAQRREAAAQRATGKNGIRPATPTAHGSVQDKVGYAQNVVNLLRKSDTYQSKDPKTQRHLAAQVLLNGKAGKVEKVPELSASIALDLVFDGHVSHKNIVKLKRRGYSLKQLGFPTRAPRVPGKTQQTLGQVHL